MALFTFTPHYTILPNIQLFSPRACVCEIFLLILRPNYLLSTEIMNTSIINTEEKNFIESLKQIVRTARSMAYTAIDYAQIQANWLIGQRVVKQMQKGAERAEYGAHIIKMASEALTEEFGSGYSETNIRNFRAFYLTFSDLQIQQTVSAK